MADSPRDLALFNMAIGRRLHGCDLAAGRGRERASITRDFTMPEKPAMASRLRAQPAMFWT